MGILLHYTDLACVKIKTADGNVSWKFKIPACEHFSTQFGAFHAEDWTCKTILYGATWVVQLLSPRSMVMQKKSTETSIFCHHHCPSAALTVEFIPIIFNFLHSQWQSQTTLKVRPLCIISKAPYSNRRYMSSGGWRKSETLTPYLIFPLNSSESFSSSPPANKF